jgi:hypothetical protein
VISVDVDDHEFDLAELAELDRIAPPQLEQAARARAWAALTDRQRRQIVRRTVTEFKTWCSHQRILGRR